MRTLSERDTGLLARAHEGCVLLGRDDRLAVVARGPDRRKFLHAMLSQSVRDLEAGMVRPAVQCDAQGAMVAVVTLLGCADDVVLWTDRADADKLRESLDKFIVMDDVEVALDEDLALVELVGPTGSDVLRRVGVDSLPANGAVAVTLAGVAGMLWRADEAVPASRSQAAPAMLLQVARTGLGDVAGALLAHGAEAGSQTVAEALRIEAGRPRLGVDVETGTLPQEAGLVAALNYLKGCYLGQEAVAMMTYRGQLRRHLCWVDVLAGDPQPGDALTTLDGKRAGRMGSAFQRPDGTGLGLATVNRKAFAAGAELLAGTDARVRVQATTVADAFQGAVAPKGGSA